MDPEREGLSEQQAMLTADLVMCGLLFGLLTLITWGIYAFAQLIGELT